MPRMLAVSERRIDETARSDYLTGIRARQRTAAASGVRYWVFEHAEESGRFIEFIEGGSEQAVREAALAESLMDAPLTLWREVQGE